MIKALLKKIVPRGLVLWSKDGLECWRRRRAPAPKGDPRFGLSKSQLYPLGDHFDACLEEGMSRTLAGLTISKTTPVASIGSCFAEEFARHMHEAGFNYVKAEADLFASSANWGRVYTVPCLRQIVEYSVDEGYPLRVEPSAKGWFDPLREYSTPYYPTREQAETAIRAHRAASRKAFSDAELLIVTLGQNEAWVERESQTVWARIPPKETIERQPRRFEPREFSLEENEQWLSRAFTALLGLNPRLRFLITVSPVPAAATFVDPDVITRSFANKCLLRTVAARVICRFPQARYFPSFEMTLAYNPRTFKADNRHVKNETVGRIFGLLRRVVVR